MLDCCCRCGAPTLQIDEARPPGELPHPNRARAPQHGRRTVPARRRVAALALVIGLAACGGGRAPPAAVGDRDLTAELDALAASRVADSAVAGAAVAVYWHGVPVLERGYGFADLERQVPVGSDSVFRIGSVTKQFTAAAVMRLVSDGEVGLDDSLSRYVPDFPGGDAITIRHLLTHTSGIASYTRLPWFAEVETAATGRDVLVRRIAAEPAAFAPGTTWAYSNSGYYLLGIVIERVSGQTYADYLGEAVLAPAGVPGVRYCPDVQDYPGAALGYAEGDDGSLALADPLSMEHPYAAGALCASARDLALWARALASGEVVDAAAFAQMTTPVGLADGSVVPYGFGVAIGEVDGHRRFAHPGNINGFGADVAFYPDDDLSIAVVVNTESGLAEPLADALAREVLGLPPAVVEDLWIPTGERAAIVGTYEFAEVGITLEVFEQAGMVVARNLGDTDSARLRRQSDGTFRILESGATLRFTLGADRATALTMTQQGATITAARAQ